MTTELWMLILTAGLHWVLVMTAAAPAAVINGLAWSAGNRETEGKPLPAWSTRAKRLSQNMQENLILFAIAVLVVQVSGSASELSAFAAQLFFGSRVAHALCYLFGIPWLRTAAWTVSIVGLALLVSVLF